MVAFFLNVTAFQAKRGHVLKKDGGLLEKELFREKRDKSLAWLQCMPMKHFFNLAFVKSIALAFMNDDSF